MENQEPNPEYERGRAFSKDVVFITGSVIMAGLSGYKDITNTSLLFKAGGLSLLLTFIMATILTNFQLHVARGACRSQCTGLSSAVLVSLTSILLNFTNTMFVVLMKKDDTLLEILVLPVVLVLGMFAGADVPADASAQGSAPADQVGPHANVPADATAQGTVLTDQVGPHADVSADAAAQGTASADQVGPHADVPADQVGPAYDDWMKSNNELASFGATTAFAIEGIIILAYLKHPSFGGAGHSQVDLAVSFFAATISVLTMTVTALPFRDLFPSARPRLVTVVGHLRCAMLAALISMAMIIAVEFLEWWLMLSLLPEVIVGSLNMAMMSGGEGGGGAPGPDGADVDDGGAAEREWMVKTFKNMATIIFMLMAGTYAVYLGHNTYDIYLRGAMLVMLAAIVSSLRQILRPFDLALARARGWSVVAIKAVLLLFPGLALLIAGPLLGMLFVHFVHF